MGTIGRAILTRRRLIGAGAAAAAGFGLAAIPPGEAAKLGASPIVRGGTPRLLQPTGIDHLDPTTNTYPAGFVISLVHGQLFKWAHPPLSDRGALIPEPYMASSIELPDPTTALVHLRRDIRFHDIDPANGRRVRADDVVATWERIKDPSIGSIRTLQQEPVHVPTAVNDRTVKFTFDHPYAPFFNYLADVWQSILPREAIDKGTDWLKQNAVGCGPFQVSKIDTGIQIVLNAQRIPWWTPWNTKEPAPYFDGIVLLVIPDNPAKQATAFLGGLLDYAPVFDPRYWETVEQDGRFAWRRFAAQDMNYMRIQTALAPTNDARVRKALSIGFSRGRIVRKTFDGYARATGPIPTSRVPWGQRTSDLPNHSFDQQEGRMLLRAAGLEDGVDLVNLLPNQDNFQTDYVKAVSAQLRNIGVRLEHHKMEYGSYLERARLGKTDPERAGWHLNMHWGNRYNDPSGYQNEYRTDELGGRNYGHWGSPELDKKIEAASRDLDVPSRVEAVHAVNRTIAEQCWTPGLLLPIQMEAWNGQLEQMAVGPEWFQGTRSFIDAWFGKGPISPEGTMRG